MLMDDDSNSSRSVASISESEANKALTESESGGWVSMDTVHFSSLAINRLMK